MGDKTGKGNLLRHIEATVMKQTFEVLEQMMQETGLSIGEVIDRLALTLRPRDQELAVWMAIEEIALIISNLSQEEKAGAIVGILMKLASLLSVEEIERLQEAVLAARKELFPEDDDPQAKDGEPGEPVQ